MRLGWRCPHATATAGCECARRARRGAIAAYGVVHGVLYDVVATARQLAKVRQDDGAPGVGWRGRLPGEAPPARGGCLGRRARLGAQQGHVLHAAGGMLPAALREQLREVGGGMRARQRGGQTGDKVQQRLLTLRVGVGQG